MTGNNPADYLLHEARCLWPSTIKEKDFSAYPKRQPELFNALDNPAISDNLNKLYHQKDQGRQHEPLVLHIHQRRCGGQGMPNAVAGRPFRVHVG